MTAESESLDISSLTSASLVDEHILAILANAKRPATYSSTFLTLYERVRTPEGAVLIRNIGRSQLQQLYEEDFQLVLAALNRSVRMVLYKLLRRFIRTYPGYQNSNNSADDFWLYLSQSFKAFGPGGLSEEIRRRELAKSIRSVGPPSVHMVDKSVGVDTNLKAMDCIDLCSDDEDKLSRGSAADTRPSSTSSSSLLADIPRPAKSSGPNAEPVDSDQKAVAPGNDNPKRAAKQVLPRRKITKTRSKLRKSVSRKSVDITRDASDIFVTGTGTELNVEKITQQIDNVLQITCTPLEFYALQPRLISASVIQFPAQAAIAPPTTTTTNDSTAISTDQLLQWPSVSLHLKLGDVSCSRRVRPNYQRHLLLNNAALLHDLNVSANDTRMRRLVAASSPQTQPQLSKLIFETFLTMLVQCLDPARLAQPMQNDLRAILQIILHDFGSVPRLHLHQKYAQFRRAHRFVRLLADADEAVRLRESINPETEFAVEACPFVCGEGEADWTEELYEYFERIFVHRQLKSMDDLTLMLCECMRFGCDECGVEFTGPSALVECKRHVQLVHVLAARGRSQWQCVECEWRTAGGSSGESWEHACIGAQAMGPSAAVTFSKAKVQSAETVA